MKKRPDLNKLAQEVFEANTEKGFHDKEISNMVLIMLVITELSEAVEAHRKGKRFSKEDYEWALLMECQGWLTPDEQFKNVFEKKVKDTLEDELADAVIRLLDLAGLRSTIIHIEDFGKCIVNQFWDKKDFTECIYLLTRHVSKYVLPSDDQAEYVINSNIAEIEGLCEYLSIDLWLHVELKLRYNKLRPKNHGGKLY